METIDKRNRELELPYGARSQFCYKLRIVTVYPDDTLDTITKVKQEIDKEQKLANSNPIIIKTKKGGLPQ